MGLGPPVCDECFQILHFNNRTNRWYCGSCGRSNIGAAGLWEFPEDEQEDLEKRFNELRKKLEQD